MSNLGKRLTFDGVPAAYVTRGTQNGRYRITFERSVATLEQIEKINWARPVVEKLPGYEKEPSLPEGYGFDVVNIGFDYGNGIYRVEVATAQQYLGDVTEYQEQIAALEATVSDQKTQLSEKDATIQTMKEAGTAADLGAELDAAYKEGVNSVE